MRVGWRAVAAGALLGATALFAQQLATAPQGYIGAAGLVDAARYLPPPPEAGSEAARIDLTAVRDGRKRALADTKLAAAATAELHMSTAAARAGMLCAMDADLTPANAPAFFRLMTRAGTDLSMASTRAKDVWHRPRPFAADATPDTCYPVSELARGLSWSYPSGHSATGWLWGMVMSEVVPDRAAEALAWGANVGEHRIACGVHYPSDVMAGRMLGSALFARMAALPEFRSDVDAAKREVAAVRAKGGHARGCPA